MAWKLLVGKKTWRQIQIVSKIIKINSSILAICKTMSLIANPLNPSLADEIYLDLLF